MGMEGMHVKERTPAPLHSPYAAGCFEKLETIRPSPPRKFLEKYLPNPFLT